MKSVSEKEFSQLDVKKVYEKRAEDDKKVLLPALQEIQKYIPNAEFAYGVSVYEEYIEYHSIRIEFTVNDIRFWFHKIYRENKYQITAYMEHFTNVSRYDIENITKKYEKPCNIGVFTTKKVNDWINYNTAIYNEVAAKNSKNTQEITEFMGGIEKEAINWRNEEHTNGEIRRNGLIFSFSIEKGYISKDIKLDYMIKRDYEQFRLMADNKYLPTKR